MGKGLHDDIFKQLAYQKGTATALSVGNVNWNTNRNLYQQLIVKYTKHNNFRKLLVYKIFTM